MEEKIVQLNEDDLENVVGGALNQGLIQNLGLVVETGRNGAQRLVGIDVKAENTSNPGIKNTWDQTNDTLNERQINSLLNGGYDQLSVTAQTASGGKVNLTRNDLKQLIS